MKHLISLLVIVGFIFGCAPRKTVVVTPGGPPPHAKAYGYRAKHTCWYYPDAEVYYVTASKKYAVLEGGNWVVITTPPKGVVLGSYVVIESDNDKPWLKHAHYKVKHPGKFKGGKGKGRKNK